MNNSVAFAYQIMNTKIIFAKSFIRIELQLLVVNFYILLEHLSVVELYFLVYAIYKTISLRQATIKVSNLVVRHEKYRYSPNRNTPRQR